GRSVHVHHHIPRLAPGWPPPPAPPSFPTAPAPAPGAPGRVGARGEGELIPTHKLLLFRSPSPSDMTTTKVQVKQHKPWPDKPRLGNISPPAKPPAPKTCTRFLGTLSSCSRESPSPSSAPCVPAASDAGAGKRESSIPIRPITVPSATCS
ncbi:hypothetical protein Vafri_15140, partial [Volvox africanus]